jgi:hypothetical protein
MTDVYCLHVDRHMHHCAGGSVFGVIIENQVPVLIMIGNPIQYDRETSVLSIYSTANIQYNVKTFIDRDIDREEEILLLEEQIKLNLAAIAKQEQKDNE